MKQILSILILVALALPLPAQQLYVGANWHPHDLTSDEISRDIRLMQEAGFNVVRLGHLAWDSYEPREGEYSFAWFDPVLDQCEAAGIKVILDIPVRPAPMWLHKKYPGVNIVDGRGGIIYPNHRYMQDVGDPDYQRCALALTEAMTARYGSHPAVIGFGLDNEAASGATSYSEYVRKRFVSWLERKYGTTDALNTAWAGQRWSRRLSDFDEVVLPNGNGQPEKRLDFQRFISDEVNGFYIKMLDIIERNAPGAQTYSNCWYYADGKPYDYAPFVYTGRMTRGGAGIYPGSLLSSDVHSTLFGIARIQYESPTPFWCCEFQTRNSTPGAVRRFAYQTLMYGSEMVCGWTWQTMHGGEEQFYTGMMDWDGTPNEKYDEYRQIASEFKKIQAWFPYKLKAEAAIALSFDSRIHPGFLGSRHERSIQEAFNLFYDRNLDVRVVDLARSSLDYKLLIIPDVSVIDKASAENIRRFVERGGTVLMTGDSGQLDATGQVFRTTLPGRLADVFGIRVGKFMDTASVKELAGLSANDRNMTVNYKGSPIHVQAAYFDIIEPRGATVTGTLSGIDSERPIITENRYGLGRAIFVGLAETPAYLSIFLDEMIGQLGIRRAPEVPTGVQVRRIDEQHFLYFNSTPNPQTILVGRPSRSLLHDVRLDASFTLSPYEPEFIEIR